MLLSECGKAYVLPSTDSRLDPVAVPAHELLDQGAGLRNDDQDSKTIYRHRTNFTSQFCAFGDVQRKRILLRRSLSLPSESRDTTIRPVACLGYYVRKQLPHAAVENNPPCLPLFLKGGSGGYSPYEARQQ